MGRVLAFAVPEPLVTPDAPPEKLWWSALELSDLRLPGLPRDKRKINQLAARERWHDRVAADGSPLARTRAGRGGGVEYHIDILPPLARAKIAQSPLNPGFRRG
jgi:putative transposase